MATGIKHGHSALLREGGFVRKVLEPDMQLGGDRRALLADQIRGYYKALRWLEIPVPAAYALVDEGGHLVECASDCGLDGYTILRQGEGPCSGVEVVRAITHAALPILLQGEPWSVSIDLHPANWCFDATGRAAYVDFHPPRYLFGGQYLVGFPQPTDPQDLEYCHRRYFSAAGLLRMLRFNIVRAGGLRMNEALTKAVAEYPPAVQEFIRRQFPPLPSSVGEIGDRLGDLGVWDVDELREIALWVSTVGDGTTPMEFLTDMLELTFVDFRVPRTERAVRIERAKELIRRRMSM